MTFSGQALPPFARTESLIKEYGPAAARVPVLRGVDIHVDAGERVALLGKSGSGKSTLLHLLAGLDVATSGRVTVDGRDLSGLSRDERARYRLTTVGVVFQAFHLIPGRTTVDNVALPLTLSGTAKKDRRARAAESLERVGLGHRLTHKPSELSGGERQRVAVARALVNRPKFLLADEPTGNLDTETGRDVMGLIQDHAKQTGASLLLVTHDAELARLSSDRVLTLRDGLLVD
jgi:putative ABC transport system ATP-binding protein